MRRLAGVVTIAGLGALLVAASPAAAAPGDDARIVREFKTINSGEMDGMAVRCGPGERALGGGTYEGTFQAANGPIDASGYVASTEDGDVPVYWFTAVYNATGSSRQFNFFAVCSASSDATVQRAEVHLAAPSGASQPRGDGTAACPSGQRAIGGGITYASSTVAGGTRIDASGPLDETGTTANTQTGDVARYWYGAVSNYDPALGDGQYYGIYAVCSAASQATLRTQEFGVDNNIERSQRCPAGSRATGGGAVPVEDGVVTVIGESTPTDALGSPYTLDTGAVPMGWRTLIDNETLANDAVKHSVVCDPATPPTATAAAAAPTGQRAAALAKCKKKPKQKRKKCRRRALLLPV